MRKLVIIMVALAPGLALAAEKTDAQKQADTHQNVQTGLGNVPARSDPPKVGTSTKTTSDYNAYTSTKTYTSPGSSTGSSTSHDYNRPYNVPEPKTKK